MRQGWIGLGVALVLLGCGGAADSDVLGSADTDASSSGGDGTASSPDEGSTASDGDGEASGGGEPAGLKDGGVLADVALPGRGETPPNLGPADGGPADGDTPADGGTPADGEQAGGGPADAGPADDEPADGEQGDGLSDGGVSGGASDGGGDMTGDMNGASPDAGPGRACRPGQLAAWSPPDGDPPGVPDNILFIIDRSGSMDEDYGGEPRWVRVRDAVRQVLEGLENDPTVGALFYPSPDTDPSSDPDASMPPCNDPTGIACLFVPGLTLGDGTCEVHPIDSGDQRSFRSVSDFLQPDLADLYTPVPGGRSPLREALVHAESALSAATLDGTTGVVIISDGAANCDWDQTEAEASLARLAASGVTTSLVTLPGTPPTQAGFAMENTIMLNPAELATALASALGTGPPWFDCALPLVPVATDPDSLVLTTTESGRSQEYAHGADWTVSADGTLARLTGDLCTAAQAGAIDTLSIEQRCP